MGAGQVKVIYLVLLPRRLCRHGWSLIRAKAQHKKAPPISGGACSSFRPFTGHSDHENHYQF
jgi:hypothetical protein